MSGTPPAPVGPGPGPDGRGHAPVGGEPVRAQLAALAARGVTWPAWARQPTDGLRPAAVLILFGALDGRPAEHPSPTVPADLDLLLVGRAADLSHHPGQVAFPGGRAELADDGPAETALREATEETGLDPAGVDVLGTLGTLPVPVSRHAVTPVLAWWARQSPVGVVDSAESATVFRAPVADLVDPARRGSVVGSFQGGTFSSPAFEVAGHVVWGFTGMVLDHLLAELGWTEPWDARRLVERPPRTGP